MTNVRTVKRPRRYVARHWLLLSSPLFTYNFNRDAHVLRGIGKHVGPVLLEDRRRQREPNRRPWPDRPARLSDGRESAEGVDRRRAGLA
jgi:hypothetical protein